MKARMIRFGVAVFSTALIAGCHGTVTIASDEGWETAEERSWEETLYGSGGAKARSDESDDVRPAANSTDDRRE